MVPTQLSSPVSFALILTDCDEACLKRYLRARHGDIRYNSRHLQVIFYTMLLIMPRFPCLLLSHSCLIGSRMHCVWLHKHVMSTHLCWLHRKASGLLHGTLQWRKESDLSSLRIGEFGPDLATGRMYIGGYDTHGHPILVSMSSEHGEWQSLVSCTPGMSCGQSNRPSTNGSPCHNAACSRCPAT